MAALGVDKFACRGWKSDNRGNWGTGFMAGAAGVATSITGGPH
jgi:hypothetical protein